MGFISIVYMKTVIQSLINYISQDLNDNINNGTEENSFLYKIWDGVSEDKYNFYEQAKDIFGRTVYDPHKLTVSLQYNKNLNSIPNIWIREPARRKGSYNSIGDIQEEVSDDGYTKLYRDTKMSNYELMITSNNTLSTILVCETIYHALLGAHDTLTKMFDVFDFNMKELISNNELTPTPIIIKSIEITTQSQTFAPSIIQEDIVNNINFIQTVYGNE